MLINDSYRNIPPFEYRATEKSVSSFQTISSGITSEAPVPLRCFALTLSKAPSTKFARSVQGCPLEGSRSPCAVFDVHAGEFFLPSSTGYIRKLSLFPICRLRLQRGETCETKLVRDKARAMLIVSRRAAVATSVSLAAKFPVSPRKRASNKGCKYSVSMQVKYYSTGCLGNAFRDASNVSLGSRNRAAPSFFPSVFRRVSCAAGSWSFCPSACATRRGVVNGAKLLDLGSRNGGRKIRGAWVERWVTPVTRGNAGRKKCEGASEAPRSRHESGFSDYRGYLSQRRVSRIDRW